MRSSHALSFERGAPRPVAPGVLRLRTPDGVVSVRSKAPLRPRKAAGLLKLPVRSPSSFGGQRPRVWDIQRVG